MQNLSGMILQKGDSHKLFVDLSFSLSGSIEQDSTTVSQIPAEYLPFLKGGFGWSVRGDSIPPSTTVVNICLQRSELLLSAPATATETALLTITTGTLSSKTVTFVAYTGNGNTKIEKTATITSATTAEIEIQPEDTESLSISDRGTIFHFLVQAKDESHVDTIAAGKFTVVPFKETPVLPEC